MLEELSSEEQQAAANWKAPETGAKRTSSGPNALEFVSEENVDQNRQEELKAGTAGWLYGDLRKAQIQIDQKLAEGNLPQNEKNGLLNLREGIDIQRKILIELGVRYGETQRNLGKYSENKSSNDVSYARTEVDLDELTGNIPDDQESVVIFGQQIPRDKFMAEAELLKHRLSEK